MQKEKLGCVTGGTSGIGRAVVMSLLGDGWRVVAVGRGASHANELRSLANDKGLGDTLWVHQGDLSDFEFCKRIADDIRSRHDRLNLLVNGAGTIGAGGVQDETPERWNSVLVSSLNSAFNMTKACLELLSNATNASVVNVSSVCSMRPCTSIAYSVSKAGMDMFTRAAAKELAQLGIRVNSVNPSVVRSNLQKTAGLFNDDNAYEEWIEQMAPAHPLGRTGLPEDVVAAARFLSSEDASWITGAILAVDGGRSVA